jgi:hypothetical protein
MVPRRDIFSHAFLPVVIIKSGNKYLCYQSWHDLPTFYSTLYFKRYD